MSGELEKGSKTNKSNLSKISEHTPAEQVGSVASVDIPDLDGRRRSSVGPLKRELNFTELWGKHYWRQFTSVTPGLVILFAGGIQIYWSAYKLEKQLEKPLVNRSNITDATISSSHRALFHIGSWYVGIIVGSLIGIALVSLLLKRTIYYLGTVLLIISSFFFIKSDHLLFIGRFISGLSHGLIHLIVIVHASDNVSKRSRGAILRSISYVLAFSLLIAIVTNASHGDFERTNVSVGIYTLGYAIFALVLIPNATNESIPFLLMHDKEEFAIQKYVQLRSERSPTPATKQGFELIKSTVLADQKYSANIFTRDNLKPLALITGARLSSLLLTNVPLMIFLLDNIITQNYITPQKLIWLQSARIIFGFVPIFVAEPKIRNRLIYKLTFCSGCVLFILQLFRELSEFVGQILSVAAIFFYLFTTIGLDAIQYVQAAEAFPLTTKHYSLAFVAIIENLIHILLFVLYHFNFISILVYTCAIGLILLSTLMHIYMPNISALAICDARAFYK